MAYGKFNKTVQPDYGCYTYTENGTGYVHTVHIFKTVPGQMGVAGAVSDKVTSLTSLTPSVCSSSKVIARINGNYIDNEYPYLPFHGIFYAGDEFNYDGMLKIEPDDERLKNTMYNANFHRVSPSLGINTTTGKATIRWPNCYTYPNTITPKKMTEDYDVIIAGQHCLVHNGVPVFEATGSSIYPHGEPYSYEGITIARWLDWSEYYHHNEILGSGNSHRRRSRTLFGHAPDGACFLVCVEGKEDSGVEIGTFGMDLRAASRLMADLGCDYALNMDGGSPSQMNVRGVKKYSTLKNGYNVGSAICVYDL